MGDDEFSYHLLYLFFWGGWLSYYAVSYRDSETYAMIFPILEGEPIRMTHGSCRIGGFCSRCSTGATAGFLPTGWVLTSHKPWQVPCFTIASLWLTAPEWVIRWLWPFPWSWSNLTREHWRICAQGIRRLPYCCSTPWSKYMAQSPQGRWIQGIYKPIHGNCAIYFCPGATAAELAGRFLARCPCRMMTASRPVQLLELFPCTRNVVRHSNACVFTFKVKELFGGLTEYQWFQTFIYKEKKLP